MTFPQISSPPRSFLKGFGPAATGAAVVGSLFPLAFGVALGAGMALLLAPRSGAETRKNLARRFSFDRNEKFAETVREEGGLPGPMKHIAP